MSQQAKDSRPEPERIMVRANSKAEFDQADSYGQVYGRMTAIVTGEGEAEIFLYVELGKRVSIDAKDRGGKYTKTDNLTKSKLFIQCTVTPAKSMEELYDEDLELESYSNKIVFLYY